MNNEKFCQFCGKALNNEPCDCSEATTVIQKNEEPATPSPVVHPPAVPSPQITPEEVTIESPNDSDSSVSNNTVQHVEQEPAPTMHSYSPSPTPQGVHPPVPEQNLQVPPQLKKAAEDIGTTFKSFLTNPLAAIDSGKNIPSSNGLILLGVNFGILFLLWCVVLLKTAHSLVSFKTALIYPLFTYILSVGILFGILFLANQLLSGTGTMNELVNLVSLSTIPIVGVFAITTLTVLFFGFASVTNFVVSVVSVFGFVLTILLIERGLRSMITKDLHRMLVLALAVAIQLTIATGFFVNGVATDLMYSSMMAFSELW